MAGGWNKGLTKETDPRVAKNAIAISQSYKIGKSIAWRKGLTIQDERIAKWAKEISTINKGRLPWSKGLTKETDLRLFKLSQAITRINNTKEWKEKSSIAHKIYYMLHPENHPNTIMARNRLRKGYISKGQLELYNYIKQLYSESILNFPVRTLNSVRFIDIAVPSVRIGFEYDGYFWHQNEDADKERDKELEEAGWEIIHFRE